MKTHGSLLPRVADLILIISALTLVGFTIADRVIGGPPSAASSADLGEPPANWQAELSTGISMGNPDAKLQIIEFMDFQCPYCAQWHAKADSPLNLFPGSVRVVMHHFPLQGHAQAVSAAIAVECAHQQGKVREFQSAIFGQRQLLGSKPWTEFARESGVQDLDHFEKCAALPADSFPRIRYGKQLGEKGGVRGTPTIWINGRVERPSLERLKKMVDDQR